MKKRNELAKEIQELRSAIKADCIDCNGGQKKVDCEVPECSLYPYRPFPQNKRR